ncbi:TetR/AcrR family transcriptional regulator [Brevibacillus thermoruber]|uniref:TetR/AcrR family transcriptional regulator n=1 Tax=Brevibacillus thermoruber TaxID=33942 RepID=UPI0040417386
MTTRERIMEAARRLAARHPFDKISFADVAKAAGVHWTAVRRHFGSKQEMRAWLAQQQADSAPSLADTRTRILDAAARVFARLGYAGASLEQVAADAGMTKGAVYWHFSSKSDLFAALCEKNLTQQLQVLSRQAASALDSASPAQGLARLLQSQFACVEEGQGNPMLFFEFVTASRDPAVGEALRAAYGKIIDGVSGVIAQLQESGAVKRDCDPGALAVLFQALINGLLLGWLIAPDRIRFEQVVPELSRVLWQGLQPSADDATAPV